MRVKDVDINKIDKLLHSVPDAMEIESIQLTNGYSLRLIAGTDEINAAETEEALRELRTIINRHFRDNNNPRLKK